jgi:hypothetical protein
MKRLSESCGGVDGPKGDGPPYGSYGALPARWLTAKGCQHLFRPELSLARNVHSGKADKNALRHSGRRAPGYFSRHHSFSRGPFRWCVAIPRRRRLARRKTRKLHRQLSGTEGRTTMWAAVDSIGTPYLWPLVVVLVAVACLGIVRRGKNARLREETIVREEIIKRLPDLEKTRLINQSVIREASGYLRCGTDFSVVHVEESRGDWHHRPPSFTDGGSHDFAAAYQRAYEEQYLTEHGVDSTSESWVDWTGSYPEHLRLVARPQS